MNKVEHKVVAKNLSPKFLKLESGPRDKYILAKIPYDIHCGGHSGFPDCCIKFFITKWIWVWDDRDSKFVKSYRKRINKLRPGYIACPKCLKSKKFIKVQPCPKSCRLKMFVWGKDWWKKK